MSVYYSVIDDGIVFSNSFFECAKMVKKHGVDLTLDRLAHHIIVKTGGKTKYDMNPFQSWEKYNPKMMKGLQKIFATDMSIIENSKEKELVEEFKKEWGSSSLLKKIYLLKSTWSIKELKTLGLIE
jgi:hypothetical protein